MLLIFCPLFLVNFNGNQKLANIFKSGYYYTIKLGTDKL